MIPITSKNGETIPYIGLGTFPFQGKVMHDMITRAVKIGYRLFDTSDDYRGEDGIGLAISRLYREEGFGRDNLFIQTKISDNNAYANEPLKGVFFNPNNRFMQRHSVEEIVREKVSTSLKKLCTNYLDSLLIHYPFPGYYVDIWKTMIALKKEGTVRYIGVSNFHESHIDYLFDNTGVLPDINELYISPIATKNELVNYCIKKNIIIHTYSPLMDVSSNRISGDLVRPIMEKYNKTLAQIIIRWNIERGCLPLPKTKNEDRLRENLNVFDFSLTKEEIAVISSMNRDYQYLVESKICPGI